MTQQKKKSKIPKAKNIKSDALFKKIMETPIAAREFLETYLPEEFKAIVDLSTVKVEKESYVQDDLKKNLSDLLYSIKTKEGDETTFAYILIEHQSNVDYWIALRLWQYMLLIADRHKDKKNNKLPLIVPMVFYNGKKKYDAPRKACDLFQNPELANKLMCEEYALVDLQSMLDEDIYKKDHLGMLEYFMKHIHYRDQLKIWEEFFKHFKRAILIDAENGHVYIKQLLWYTDGRVAEQDTSKLKSNGNREFIKNGRRSYENNCR